MTWIRPDLQDFTGRLGAESEGSVAFDFISLVGCRHGREQDSERADKLVQDIMKARTTSQFETVIEDDAPDNQHAITQPIGLVRSLLPCTPLDQLIIRPGGSGGMLIQAKYQLERFCSELKLSKRTADRLNGMIKQRKTLMRHAPRGAQQWPTPSRRPPLHLGVRPKKISEDILGSPRISEDIR